jgi:hypothetical protein
MSESIGESSLESVSDNEKEKDLNWASHPLVSALFHVRKDETKHFGCDLAYEAVVALGNKYDIPDLDDELYILEQSFDVSEILREEQEKIKEISKSVQEKLVAALEADPVVKEFIENAITAKNFEGKTRKERATALKTPEYKKARQYFLNNKKLDLGGRMRKAGKTKACKQCKKNVPYGEGEQCEFCERVFCDTHWKTHDCTAN